MKYLLIAILLFSCAKDNDPQEPIEISSELQEKKLSYLQWEKESNTNADGFVHGGDGMLFSCLKYAAGGLVNWKASHALGDLYWMIRSPDYEPNKTSENWTYYSKDMFVGELICIWVAQDLAFLEGRINWLENNGWDLCGGKDYASSWTTHSSTCLVKGPIGINYNLVDTAYEMRKQLGGSGHPATWVPQVWNPSGDDYPAHLSVLQILIRGVIMDGINDIQLAYLKNVSKRNPGNALYAAVYGLFSDGNMDKAINLLENEVYFPYDSLPSSDEYCTEYLFQRAQYDGDKLDKDWLPCPEEDAYEMYDGVDFMFATTVAEGNFK